MSSLHLINIFLSLKSALILVRGVGAGLCDLSGHCLVPDDGPTLPQPTQPFTGAQPDLI